MDEHAEAVGTSSDDSTMLAIERTFLAYERTLLAWTRTSTSLITFGFSIQQFFRIARTGVTPPDGRLIGPQEFGLAMMSIGLITLGAATVQHRYQINALNHRYAAGFSPVPASFALGLACLIALLGTVGILSMIFRS